MRAAEERQIASECGGMRQMRLHAVGTAWWPVLLPALCAALWACAGPPERRPADPVPAGRWRELRSEHFLLYTDLHRDDARRLAGELELFRAAVLHFTNVDGSPGPVPVRIFAFRDPAHYHRFAPGGVAGFARAGLRHVDVALSASSPEAYRIILYHEAVHLLMRGQPRRILPKWYEEGLADFLSTLVQVDDRVVVGSVSPLRAGWLVHAPPLPLSRLLASESFAELSEDGMQRFYAWAWLLAHYVSMDHDYAEGDSALAALGASHLLDGEDPALAIAPLERAFEIVPQDWLVQRGLVEAYSGAGRSEDAERMARRLLLAVHDRAQADALRAFLQEVEDGPAREGGP